MKKNVLYLREMGCNDPDITTDIKNHRVRVLENIDIKYKGEEYNMFFEFMQGTHWHYRTTNKRTGKELKRPKYEVILNDALFIDTQFERLEGTWKDGTPYFSSWRKSDLEREFWEEHHAYTRKDILAVVNRYKIGEKFTEVVLIEAAAAEIIRKNGGWREKDILGKASRSSYGECYFEIGDTWTDEHKIIRVVQSKRTEEGKWITGNFCEVDILTGKITG